MICLRKDVYLILDAMKVPSPSRLVCPSPQTFLPTRWSILVITDSKLVAQCYAPSRIVGVDIDEHLIRLAWKRRRTSWSLQSPSSPAGGLVVPSLSRSYTYQATDLSKKRKRQPSLPSPAQSHSHMNKEPEIHAHNTRIEPDYFPAVFEYMFGPIAFPPSPTTSQWPNNVAFYCTDWMKDQQEESFLERENEEGWDVILACVLDRCAERASVSTQSIA